MKFGILPIAFAAITILFLSCSDLGSTGIPVPYENIQGLSCLDVSSIGPMVIQDDSTWQTLWRTYCGGFDSAGNQIPPPAVDFSHDMLVAVFWGCSYSGCFNAVDVIDITQISDEKIQVNVGMLPSLGYCEMIVCPMQIVRISKTSLPIIFTGNVPG